jgi:rubredoxin-NAD+ reductase
MKTDPIIIVGSGLAGYLFAKEFRKLNTTTTLHIITASDGCFYSKPLLSTALTQQKAIAELAIYDAKTMAEQLNATIYTETQVKSIDPLAQTISFDNDTLTYSQLILACGSYAIHLPLTGDGINDVHSVNDLQAYAVYRQWLAHKQHIAILGSGLVGCEFANDLINTGHEVDIISLDDYPLAKFVPASIGNALRNALAVKGVKWHLQRSAQSVHRVNATYAVTLNDQTQVFADGVFSAVGIRPLIELAKLAGLQINRGIVVDRHLRTSVNNIYALGDCAEVNGELRQYVAPVMQCARVLAGYLNGQAMTVRYEPMPIIVKTPACPVVAIPPPAGLVGEWRNEINGCDGKALFYDEKQQLRGFALIGAGTKARLELTKQLPAFVD